MSTYVFNGNPEGQEAKNLKNLERYRPLEVQIIRILYFKNYTMHELVVHTGFSRAAVWRALCRLRLRGNIRGKEKKRRGFSVRRPHNIRYEWNPEYENINKERTKK